MKSKIIISILAVSAFLFSGTKLFAQGNLQFNQVILIDLPTSGTYTINVPVGKVWKIETGNSYNGGNTGIVIRNSAVAPIAVLSTSASAATSNYPFWLPTGFSGSFLNSSSSGRACLSIIEFNVVP